MNFSFAGCGFLGIYHVGVTSCLKQHIPQLLDGIKFSGASAGSMVACCLMCDCCLGMYNNFCFKYVIFTSSYNILSFNILQHLTY